DIQCASSDTRPPMIDRTDFASWQQRIRLYCRGKKNGVNILKSIDEGPFQIGTVREPLAEGTEGTPPLGPERPRVLRQNAGSLETKRNQVLKLAESSLGKTQKMSSISKTQNQITEIKTQTDKTHEAKRNQEYARETKRSQEHYELFT
nr:integrase, catalytic region, zinc finger, CCHC-type, peptidase aspartic, catalytic [Tanacetum cinerariifolium]